MIKAVIFDFDGTLLNTLPTISYYGNLALEEVGLPPVEEKKYGYFVGNGRDILIHRMLAYHNADTAENYERAGARYDYEYDKDSMYGSAIYEGILPLLESLKAEGYKIAICTNKPHNVAGTLINRLFGDAFDTFIGDTKDMPIKPAPDSALAIAGELGVSPSECAFVGDTIVDITTGKNAGMFTIGVLWGFRDAEELKDADKIIEKPDEINKILKIENEKTGEN